VQAAAVCALAKYVSQYPLCPHVLQEAVEVMILKVFLSLTAVSNSTKMPRQHQIFDANAKDACSPTVGLFNGTEPRRQAQDTPLPLCKTETNVKTHRHTLPATTAPDYTVGGLTGDAYQFCVVCLMMIFTDNFNYCRL
jgi:hypothetical protein